MSELSSVAITPSPVFRPTVLIITVKIYIGEWGWVEIMGEEK